MINLGNEINAMTLFYITVLGLRICFIIVMAQKINNSFLETYNIGIPSFEVIKKLNKAQYL